MDKTKVAQIVVFQMNQMLGGASASRCPSYVDKLGQQKRSNSKTTKLDNFPVTVKRQDSTVEKVMLMDELNSFLDCHEPDAVNKYLSYPKSFEYDEKKLQHIEGFPEKARPWSNMQSSRRTAGGKDQEEKDKEQWRKAALGLSSESKIFQMLETQFESRPSLMLNNIETEKMLQLVRESAKFSLGQSRKLMPHLFSVPLTSEERILAEALGFDHLQNEISLQRPIRGKAFKKLI